MADDMKEVHSKQSGSGSHSGQTTPTPTPNQGSSEKKAEQGHEHQAGQQTTKKGVQGEEREEENRKTGNR